MRLWDRMLSRAGYNEYMYSGAEYVFSGDIGGRGRETLQSGMVRRIREIYVADGPVFACIAARMWLFSEARFSSSP